MHIVNEMEIRMLTKKDIFNHVAQSCEKRGIAPGFNEAVFIAGYSLMEERDKADADYAHHWIQVGTTDTKSNIKKQIGILHDVVEDTNWTLDDLRALGFDERVVNGVDAMTRREDENESYFTFIERCSQDPYAIDVKLKDLEHNMSQQRNDYGLGAKDLMRLNKYIISSQYLIAIKRGDIEAGSPVETFVAEKFGQDENLDNLKAVLGKEGRTYPQPELGSIGSRYII